MIQRGHAISTERDIYILIHNPQELLENDMKCFGKTDKKEL